MKWMGIFLWLVIIALSASRVYIERHALFVSDQWIGDTVVVDKVRLFRPGKITIVTALYGRPAGTLIGQTEMLAPGTHTNVPVLMFPEYTYRTENFHEGVVSQGDTVYVVLQQTKGLNGAERVVRDMTGAIVAKPFRLN